MRYKGFDFKRNKNLAYRQGNPETDVDGDGQPVEWNYVAIVKMKDCRLYEKDGLTYYDASEAPMIPIDGHSRTNMVYGPTKVRKSEMGVWIDNELHYEYNQTTVYAVRNGMVYTASIRKAIVKENA